MTNSTLPRTALITLATSAALLGLVGCASSGDDDQPQADVTDAGTGVEQTPGGTTDSTTGNSSDDDGNNDDNNDDDDNGDDNADDGTSQQQGSSDASEYAAAITAAEEFVGDGAFAFDLEREDDDDDDDELFNIDVAEGTTVHEIDILPDGTARLDETETRELDDDDQREIDTAELTMIDAIEAALAHHGGTIEEVELETENGTVVWTIEFDDGIDELHVDAVTGDITED